MDKEHLLQKVDDFHDDYNNTQFDYIIE